MSSGYRFAVIPIAHVVANLRYVAYAFPRTYFTYELAYSNTHSWTPTAEELQYLIDHLRAQAQLNENYAREERCLAAVLDATRAYHDPTSLPYHPQTSALCISFSLLILLFAQPTQAPLPVTSPLISRSYVQSRPPSSLLTVPTAHAHVSHHLPPLPTQHAEHPTTLQLFLANHLTSP